MAIFRYMQCFHERTEGSNRKIANFSLNDISIIALFFDKLIFKNELFVSYLFYDLFIFVNLNHIAYELLLNRFFLVNLSDIGLLFSANDFVQLTSLSQFIHHFQHIIF
jgi:hypothetical protein